MMRLLPDRSKHPRFPSAFRRPGVLFGLLVLALQAAAATGHESLEWSQALQLTPGERYWQLSFMLGITDAIDEELLEALSARYPESLETAPSIPDLATYQGAGYRIASAESILAGLTGLARFRHSAETSIRNEIAGLPEAHPELLEQIDPELLAEEVLLVRSAVLDSLESLQADQSWPPGVTADSYQAGTVRARNDLEYIVYARDMDALTDRSILESDGRLDAFHRLLEDNSDTEFLRGQIMASEEMTLQLSREHRRYATQRTIRNLIILLPAISRYFRYR